MVNRSNDKAASHGAFVGRAEIGAAWSKQSSECGRAHLSPNKLDDTGYTAPIFANLFDDEDGKDHHPRRCDRKSTAD